MPAANAGSARTIIASVMLGLQGAVGVVTALALFASAHRWGRFAFGAAIEHRRMALGWPVMAVAIATLIFAIGVASGASWAAIGALVIEALVAFGALARAGIHPFATLVTLVYAGAVVALLVWRSEPHRDSGSRSDDAPPSGTSPQITA